MKAHKLWWGLLIIPLLAAYWLLPISGKVIILPGEEVGGAWPHFQLEPRIAQPGESVSVAVTDIRPWSFVILTVDGVPASPVEDDAGDGSTWTWHWRFTVPEGPGYTLVFYHDCHVGCVERGRVSVGDPAPVPVPGTVPTKLGLVLANPERDWHGRSGWAVEVTYARQSEEPFWGVDHLAARVAAHHAQGLRVLVRVDYDLDQSIPPESDYLALTAYLAYLQRLARDARLQDIHGYIIGNDFNTLESNALNLDAPVGPAWYARVFNGYGQEVTHTDNAVQVIRAAHPDTRVIVGPVRPWSEDQDGAREATPPLPWLNYMNTLVALLDVAAQTKAAAGIPLAAPDGFDIQAPGRPDHPTMAGELRADEPRVELHPDAWGGAHIGFNVFRDWLAIINAYPTTRGLPVYIVSTNTYDRDADIPPAQNYPRGWLTTALEVVNAEPQIVALCWFLDDFPHSDQWDWFSLTQQPGRLVDAAEEFDTLLLKP